MPTDFGRTGVAVVVAVLGFAFVLLLCTPAGVAFLFAQLQSSVPPAAIQTVASMRAIVVLGGGGLPRIRHAAYVHQRTGLPVLLTGQGSSNTGYRSEAEWMAAVLKSDHGLKAQWLERSANSTRENAERVWCIARASGATHVVLITDGFHMLRAKLWCKR